MAGISDSELGAIYQQIKEFPDTHSDYMEIAAAGKESHMLASREDRVRQTGMELEQLEADIRDLEKKIRQQKDKYTLHKAWQDYQSHSLPTDTNTDVVHTQKEVLKYQIDQLGEITEVKLVETKTDIVEQGKLWGNKKKHIEGYCGQVDFNLDINSHEAMNEDMTVTSRITDLSVSTSDNMQQDLGNTLDKLVEEGNVQGFLSLLQPYNTWLTTRDTTFQHFVLKYPNIASRKSPHKLHLNHPTKKVTFVVQWTFTVTDICSVVPDLQLDIQLPKHVSSRNSVLDTAPETFQLMLKELGMEKTLHSLILLLQE